MRGLAITLSLALTCFWTRVEGQELRLEIERDADETITVSALDAGVLAGHTFIEFSTNGVWFPAYFSSSNSVGGLIYTHTNTGGIRLFRATRGQTIAAQVKASWDRLGVTNYVFHYFAECLCPVTSATVTVMSNEVVKVENARDWQGNPVANPSLFGPVISEVLDAWILSEPDGGYARRLEFDTRGFPKVINIDLSPFAVDEELIYTIDSFTPLP